MPWDCLLLRTGFLQPTGPETFQLSKAIPKPETRMGNRSVRGSDKRQKKRNKISLFRLGFVKGSFVRLVTSAATAAATTAGEVFWLREAT